MAKIIDSLVSDAVKRFVMNPEYMRAAWMREMENNLLFGMTTDEMLMRGLDRDSHQLPHFAGAHVYPVFPGAAAMCGFPPLLLMPSSSYNHTLSFQGARSVCRQAACICIKGCQNPTPSWTRQIKQAFTCHRCNLALERHFVVSAFHAWVRAWQNSVFAAVCWI